MGGCGACIACHGPARTVKMSDLWTHPKEDPSHPYNVNYIGVRNLAEAAAKVGCARLVRVTGLSVGQPALSLVPVLLNLVISMTVRLAKQKYKSLCLQS
ncbi:unnamed protein product [Discosporangium mesarthrocarpum]